MTSLVIIPETTPKVNIKVKDNGAFPPLASTYTSSVAAKRCETFDTSAYATNEWQAFGLSFQWHGDDVASFDDEIHTLIERNATTRSATFRPLDQPTTRVIMCDDLLDSIKKSRAAAKATISVASSASDASDASDVSLASSSVCELPNVDLDSDPSLPLNSEEVLFCTSHLSAMGCSNAEIEQFFDDLLEGPHWYPSFTQDVHDKSLNLLVDVCDAFVYSITPVDDYVRIAGQLFHYQRDILGYEFISCMGSRGDSVVELVAYPHEVQKVKQQLVWV